MTHLLTPQIFHSCNITVWSKDIGGSEDDDGDNYDDDDSNSSYDDGLVVMITS